MLIVFLKRIIRCLSYSATHKPNKRFKRDSQRVAFLLCVGFCDYGGLCCVIRSENQTACNWLIIMQHTEFQAYLAL